MMLKNLTKYQPSNLAIYIGFGIILWLKTIIDSNAPGIYIGDNPTPIYAWIVYLIGHPGLALVCKILALVLILFQGLLFNGIINQYNLLGIRSYMPGIIFLIIIANFPANQILQPIYFATLIIILTWNLIVNAEIGISSLASYFNASLLLGISTLFYPNSIYFVTVLIASTFLNRVSTLREFAMILIGLFTVWYFYFSIIFIANNHLNFSGIKFEFNFSVHDFVELKTSQIIFFIYFSILIIISIYQSSISMTNQKIQTRRNFKILLTWFVLGSAMYLFTNSGFELIYLVAIPVSALVSLVFSGSKLKRIKEIAFILLIIITLINQFKPDLIP
jgi:hypothetical protein